MGISGPTPSPVSPHSLPNLSPLSPNSLLILSPLSPQYLPTLSQLSTHSLPTLLPLRPHSPPTLSPNSPYSLPNGPKLVPNVLKRSKFVPDYTKWLQMAQTGCTLVFLHCALYKVHCALYKVHMYTVQRTLVHCVLYKVHLYTVYYTKYTLRGRVIPREDCSNRAATTRSPRGTRRHQEKAVPRKTAQSISPS